MKPTQIGAGIQVPPNSSRILKRWGILDQVESFAVKPNAFILRSYHNGTILSKQNMASFALENYGLPYLHIHRADYHRILADEAERLGVRLMLGSRVIGIDFRQAAVKIANQPDLHADLIIGADGIRSVCREALLGRPDPPHLTGDLAYRFLVRAEGMRRNPNLRDFIEKPDINYWLGPQSHAVCYLVKGGDFFNVVLTCPDNLPETITTAKADPEEMRDLFQNWDPTLKEILGLVQETSKWRLEDVREMRSWNHPEGRFALLGDACHATLPYLCVFSVYLDDS